MRRPYDELESAQSLTEYARTLSVLTIFCLVAFALLAAAGTVAGYLT